MAGGTGLATGELRRLRTLRHTAGIPIAAGENAGTLIDFERMRDAGAIEFIQPSPAKMGGVSRLREVFGLAAVRNVPVMPHSSYSGPGLLAAIQVTAALGSTESMIEWRFLNLEAEIVGDRLTAHDGRVKVPQGPGLGLDPDPAVLHHYGAR